MGCEASSQNSQVIVPDTISPQPSSSPVREPVRITAPVATTTTTVQPKIEPLKDIKKFQFVKESQKLLTGKHSTEKTNGKDIPDIKPQDCFDTIGVVSLWYSNFCYTDGVYNNTNFMFEKGKLGDYHAYKVYPPKNKFTKFLASHHCLIFKFSSKEAYKIYRFEDNALDVAAEISDKDVKTDGTYTLVPSIKISQLGKPVVYLAVPSTQKISLFHSLSNQAEGATVFKDNNIRIQLVQYTLTYDPPTPADFSSGPNTWQNCYNSNRDIFRVAVPQKQLLICNSNSKKSVSLTTIDKIKHTTQTVQLQTLPGYELAAACGDKSYIYYSIIESGPSPDKKGNRQMLIIKADHQGKTLKKQKVPTDKDNLNIHTFDTCNMAINSKQAQIAMLVSRKMTVSEDGLNHQGAYACLISTESLQVTRQFGQTSGHSFANSLLLRESDSKFMGMDLGDNYPRGVNHWIFDEKQLQSNVVYTFKTEHGSTAQSPAGARYSEYKQISKGKTFYKWSNDNRTYTELAAPGVIEISDGTLIFFAGENQPRPLDCSHIGAYNNCSRNLGFVKSSKDLLKILSNGPEEKGGFFTFQGTWQEQVNKGIVWLTKLTGEQNVSRLKVNTFGNKVFILFELWDKENYINTQYMVTDLNGGILVDNTVIPFKLRVHKSDDIHFDPESKCMVVYAGGQGKVMNRYLVKEAK